MVKYGMSISDGMNHRSLRIHPHIQRHFHGVKQRDRPSIDPFDHFEPSDIQRRNRNRTTQLRMRNRRKIVEITEFFSKLAASWKVPTFQNEVSIEKVTSWTVLAAGFSVGYSPPPWASLMRP